MKNERIEKCEEYVHLDIDSYNKLFVDRLSLSRENQELSSNLLAKTKELEMSEESLSNMFKQLKDLLDNLVLDEPQLSDNRLPNYELKSPSFIAQYLTTYYLDLIKEIKGIEE